jgi:multidrug transporter EmrE-like cation transporter
MLRIFPLSVAFPIAAGSLIVATHVVARLYLAEAPTAVQTLGVAVILAGIFLVFARAQ